jgi:hypothetical protein
MSSRDSHAQTSNKISNERNSWLYNIHLDLHVILSRLDRQVAKKIYGLRILRRPLVQPLVHFTRAKLAISIRGVAVYKCHKQTNNEN